MWRDGVAKSPRTDPLPCPGQKWPTSPDPT